MGYDVLGCRVTSDSAFDVKYNLGWLPAIQRLTRFIRQVRLPLVLPLFILLVLSARAATYGTVVSMPGLISDIVLDANRGVIYAANFTANRIDVISTSSLSVSTSILVSQQPSSIAMSPDGRYLVVGHYVWTTPEPDVSIIDLNSSRISRTLSVEAGVKVLAVAFGNSPQALVVLSNGVVLLDPAIGTFKSLTLSNFASTNLPVPWATFPPNIIKASVGVSGNGNRIYGMIDMPGSTTSSGDSSGGSSSVAVIRYDVTTGELVLDGVTASPALGPRVVSVDQNGDTFLGGWVLLNSALVDLAQFPYPEGSLNRGGHAFDPKRNVFYAQVTGGNDSPASTPGPVLYVVDSDNLTVREMLKIRENLAGKAIVSGDTMYAISDSGLTVLPLGGLPAIHRVGAVQEDLVFQTSGCNQASVSQFLDIVDPNGGATDFTLTVRSPGIRISPASGTTPARVQVVVDPTAFQSQKGTTAVPLQITSTQAVNIPWTVRLLINTRDPDQKGVIHNVPGTIVDVVADPSRDRLYLLRQDKNEVRVLDGSNFNQIAVLRTGNTPVQMALSPDDSALMVTNDNSQIVNVFDLNTLATLDFIVLPRGLYGRSIAVAQKRILATTRSVPPIVNPLVDIDFSARSAAIASQSALGIYINGITNPNSALAVSPSGHRLFMAMTDGTVALYDSSVDAFITSRKDNASLGGAYAALSDELFITGSHVFNVALVPVGDVNLAGGSSSGSVMVDGMGLMTVAPTGGRNGSILRYAPDQLSGTAPLRVAEAPSTAQSLATPIAGQVGQTILPFTRTVSVLSNGQSIIQLSTSGFISLARAFDAGLQQPAIKAITNAADQMPGIAPGGLISIWGSGLSNGTASANQLPLSKGLSNICVYANSVPLSMLYVSASQLNAQLPFAAPPNATLVISSPGGQSVPFNFTVQPAAPAVFLNGSGIPLIIRTVDGKLITDSTPIHLNEQLIIYMTGLGAVSPAVDAGVAAPSNPLSTTNVTPSITIGGASIWTLWSGLAPGLAGVYQVNAQVPFHHIPTGSNIPFTITQGGASTTIKLRVEE